MKFSTRKNTYLTRLIPTRLTRLTRLTCLFGREVKLDFFILIFEEPKNPKLIEHTHEVVQVA